MAEPVIRFAVLGQPVTQGSKRAFVNKHTGRAGMVENKAEELKSWREAIRSEAQRAVESGARLIDGPVVVRLFFGLAKPSSAPKRRRTFPIAARSGDVDKLARAVLDALTGVLFGDDSQVVSLTVSKDYSARIGAVVEVEEHDGDDVPFPGINDLGCALLPPTTQGN